MAEFTRFEEGDDILATKMMGNFDYVLERVGNNAENVQNYVEGEVATIKSNVASVQATLQNNIDLVNELVQAMYTNLMPDYSKGVLIESGYKAPSAGYVYARTGGIEGTSGKLSVNGVEVGTGSNTDGGFVYSSTYALVSKDDVITFTASKANFYPLKGVANDD